MEPAGSPYRPTVGAFGCGWPGPPVALGLVAGPLFPWLQRLGDAHGVWGDASGPSALLQECRALTTLGHVRGRAHARGEFSVPTPCPNSLRASLPKRVGPR